MVGWVFTVTVKACLKSSKSKCFYPEMLLFSSPGSITSGFSFKILLLMIVLEALSRKMKSGYPEQLLYADISAMVSESTERLKGKLETSKGALEVL